MKKRILALRAETLRHLTPDQLARVAGGYATNTCSGFPTVGPCTSAWYTNCTCPPNPGSHYWSCQPDCPSIEP